MTLSCGSTQCIRGCSVASLTSIHYVPTTRSGGNQKCPQILPNFPQGQNCPQLRNTVLGDGGAMRWKKSVSLNPTTYGRVVRTLRTHEILSFICYIIKCSYILEIFRIPDCLLLSLMRKMCSNHPLR